LGEAQGGLNAQSYASPAEGFDRLALRYDDLVEANPLHAQLRRRSLAWLEEGFRPGMRVLDLGCGVGTEAIHLARRGIRVVATDISPAMIEQTRSRARTAGVADLVDVVACRIGELSATLPQGIGFDGAYASFGALNCEPDLALAIRETASVVKAGGRFVASVVSRPCVSELGLGLASGNLRKAARRLREGVLIDLYGAGTVRAQAYSEGDLTRALRPWFRLERIEGWLVALPPPYLARQWVQHPWIHRPLGALDERISKVWPFRGWGDHLHVAARRHRP